MAADLRDRRVHTQPPRMLTRSVILQEIADEIESGYPMHAQWLRNMAQDLARTDAGQTPFDRRFRDG